MVKRIVCVSLAVMLLLSTVTGAFAKENKAILEMKSVKATLEDIFIELTGKGAAK